MKINEITLPPYTRKMELWNTVSHGLGVLFAIIAGPMAISKSVAKQDKLGVIATCIYVVSMLLLFVASTLYHACERNDGKRVLRVIDHDNVFFLIMGSYTPYCLITLRQPIDGFPWGFVLLGLVWCFCIVGIILNSINIKKFAKLSLVVQIIMGSVIVAAFYPLCLTLGFNGVILLLVSGIFFWVGAVLYGIGGKKNPWLHTVFHFFVLTAAILMFVSIYYFVL